MFGFLLRLAKNNYLAASSSLGKHVMHVVCILIFMFHVTSCFFFQNIIDMTVTFCYVSTNITNVVLLIYYYYNNVKLHVKHIVSNSISSALLTSDLTKIICQPTAHA